MKPTDDRWVVCYVDCTDATFDLHMGGDRLAVFVREVSVHSEMVVEPSNTPALAKYLTVA